MEKHLVVDIDLRRIGGSALTDGIDEPKNRDHADMSGKIPGTYISARKPESKALVEGEMTIQIHTLFIQLTKAQNIQKGAV